MKSAFFAAVFIMLAFSMLSVSVFAGNYMNFYSSAVVQPGQNINFTGSVYNASNTSQIIQNINVSAIVNSTVNSSLSGAGYQNNFTVNAPNAVGEYNVTVYSNDSSIMNKTFTVYVSSVTGGSITFMGNYPPFSAGSSFTINVTMKNATSGSAISNYTPNVSIFSSNGAQASWNIANLSNASDSSGAIAYNVTIPSGVDGQYVIVVEHGVIYKIFKISSGYVISAGTQDTSGATSSNFAQGSTINIVAKVRDSNGNPINSTIISNITAYITLPNSTVINKTLQVLNDSTYPGYYNSTFNIGTAAGDIGQENIKIVAGVAGKLIDSSALLNVKTFTVKLEMQKEFFKEWGGQAAFEANQNAALNIVPINTTDSSIISPGGVQLPACNSTYLQLVDVFYANGTSINSTIGSAAFGNGRSMATSVCRISFTAPANSGTYGMRVNVTVSNITVVGETYFSVQKVMMKASPVSSLGGSMDSETMVTPGDNVSISLKAYNLTTKDSLNGNNITNIVVTRIVPLQFTGGSSEYTGLIQGNNYTVTAGTATDAPIVSVTLPSSVLGPILVEIRANISGEIVTSSAFFIANYLMGFLQPQMGSSGGGMGGPGGDMGKSSFSSCTGTVTFSGNSMEVKSSSAAQGVSITSIAQAREELTGKDVSSHLTIAGSTTSTSSGALTVNVTFDSYGFSGFYFMLFNASYQGKTTGLPAGFMCKRLNFWPQIMSAGGSQQSWRIAPTGGVNITIGGAGSEVTRLNDSVKISNRSYVQLPHIMNFNPSEGGMNLLVPVNATAMNFTFNATDVPGNYSNITTNKVSFLIYPQNFSLNGKTLTSWPNGFIDLQPVITSVDINGASDTGMGGFQVVPFDAYLDMNIWNNNNQVSAGDTKSYTVYARTNVSGTEPFSVKIGRPWEGQLANVLNLQYNNTLNMSDGTQVWNVTFTIPPTLKKGGSDLSIDVNNTNGDKSTVHMWLSVVKYSVNVPAEEGMNFDYYFIPVQNSTAFNPQGNAQTYGWNMLALNTTYNVWSKSISGPNNSQTNGSVMIKNQFDATRYGMMQQNVTYNATTRVLLLDNTTAGIYDTLILNNSMGNITIINLNQRSVLNFTGGGIYLWSIDGTYVKLVNSTTTGSWGGSYQKNTNFKIPYAVKLSSAPQANVSLSVNGVGSQMDGGGNGGFGFSASLVNGLNYTSSPRYVDTDVNGVAFVNVNISKSGKFVIFWKVNTSAGDSDTASMDSGTQVEAKAFQTNGGLAYNTPRGTVNLTKNITSGVWNAFDNSTPYVYNGTIVEVGANDFVRDNHLDTWYIVYNPFTNQTKMGTSANLSSANNVQTVTINSTTQMGGGIQMGVNKLVMNTSENGTVTMQFYEDSNVGLTSSKMVSSASENVTVKVCANSFDKPQSKPKEGATFYLYVNAWSTMGPPQQQNLTMIDLNGTQYLAGSLPQLGPKGCFALNVTPSGSQLTGSSWLNGDNQIQGNIMFGADTEAVWAGEVFYNNWH